MTMPIRVSPNMAFMIAMQSGVPACVKGPPGCAKTATIYAIGRATNRFTYTMLGSIRDPSDVGGAPFPGTIEVVGRDGKPRTAECMKWLPPEYAARIANIQDRSILFMDELTTCPVAVQSSMLRIWAEFVVGDLQLPRDLWIAGACNPAELASNGVDFTPPLANRMWHGEWEIDKDSIRQGWLNGHNFPEPSIPLVPQPDEEGKGGWKNYLPGASTKVVGFLTAKPSLLQACPQKAEAQIGPWPSVRTWTLLQQALAGSDSVGAPKSVRADLVTGLVGEGAGGEFCTWEEKLDIPDPEEVLADAMKAVKAGKKMTLPKLDRADKTITVAGGVTQVVMEKMTPERASGAFEFLTRVAEKEAELAVAVAGPLLAYVLDKKVINPPRDFTLLVGNKLMQVDRGLRKDKDQK